MKLPELNINTDQIQTLAEAKEIIKEAEQTVIDRKGELHGVEVQLAEKVLAYNREVQEWVLMQEQYGFDPSMPLTASAVREQIHQTKITQAAIEKVETMRTERIAKVADILQNGFKRAWNRIGRAAQTGLEILGTFGAGVQMPSFPDDERRYVAEPAKNE